MYGSGDTQTTEEVTSVADISRWSIQTRVRRKRTIAEPIADEASFEDALAAAIPHVVTRGMDPTQTLAFLHRMSALLYRLNGRAAFERFAVSALGALTISDARKYGIHPNEFRTWRKVYQ